MISDEGVERDPTPAGSSRDKREGESIERGIDRTSGEERGRQQSRPTTAGGDDGNKVPFLKGEYCHHMRQITNAVGGSKEWPVGWWEVSCLSQNRI